MARPEKYGFSRLAVGDHVDMPVGPGYAATKKLIVAACNWGRKRGRRFSTRTYRSEGVVRCTRIE
jgi:hypothetical protein